MCKLLHFSPSLRRCHVFWRTSWRLLRFDNKSCSLNFPLAESVLNFIEHVGTCCFDCLQTKARVLWSATVEFRMLKWLQSKAFRLVHGVFVGLQCLALFQSCGIIVTCVESGSHWSRQTAVKVTKESFQNAVFWNNLLGVTCLWLVQRCMLRTASTTKKLVSRVWDSGHRFNCILQSWSLSHKIILQSGVKSRRHAALYMIGLEHQISSRFTVCRQCLIFSNRCNLHRISRHDHWPRPSVHSPRISKLVNLCPNSNISIYWTETSNFSSKPHKSHKRLPKRLQFLDFFLQQRNQRREVCRVSLIWTSCSRQSINEIPSSNSLKLYSSYNRAFKNRIKFLCPKIRVPVAFKRLKRE